jgi:hypothetical protein
MARRFLSRRSRPELLRICQATGLSSWTYGSLPARRMAPQTSYCLLSLTPSSLSVCPSPIKIANFKGGCQPLVGCAFAYSAEPQCHRKGVITSIRLSGLMGGRWCVGHCDPNLCQVGLDPLWPQFPIHHCSLAVVWRLMR